MKEEPVKEGYFAPDVEFIDYQPIDRCNCI